MVNAPTTPCPPAPELTAFESRIRTAGETTARLENLASLVVEMLEARRDFRLGEREETP